MAATDDALSNLLARNAALFALQESVGNKLETFGFVSEAVSGQAIQEALHNADLLHVVQDSLPFPRDTLGSARFKAMVPMTLGDAQSLFIQESLQCSDGAMADLVAAARLVAI